MGAILAKFKKEASTTEKLEKLEKQIQEIEKYTANTREQKRRIVGNFLAVSIGTYVIALAVTYFYYLPPTWRERFVYLVPLFLFPLIIILLRKVFSWYFERKLNKNNKQLLELRAQKKKILEEVMDKEVYKVAVNLLNRFADKTTITRFNNSTPLAARPIASNNSAQRAVYRSPQFRSTYGRIEPPLGQRLSVPSSNPLAMLNASNISAVSNTQPVTSSALTPLNSNNALQLRRQTPFPILDQQGKGIFERLVDVLLGDGPQDRFAMICKECHAHNGMALKEEFEYTTFRCAFCNVLNPSRKERPVGPRLPFQSDVSSSMQITDTQCTDSESSDHSDTESEEKVPKVVEPVQLSNETTEAHLIDDKIAATLAVEEIEDSDGSTAADNWTEVAKLSSDDDQSSEIGKADRSVEAELRQRHSEMINELKKEM